MRIEVYPIGANGQPEGAIYTGLTQPFASRPHPHRRFIFPITLAPGQSQTLYAKLQWSNQIAIPATLWTEAEFGQAMRNDYAAQALYFGMLLAMMLFNLLLLLVLLVLGGSLYGALHCQRSALYFLLAFGLLLLGAFINILRTAGWIETNLLTANIMQFGSAMEMVLLAFALANRFDAVRRQKNAAELSALQARQDAPQAHSQLLQAEKMASLGQLMTSISHEINTPLAAVKASAEHLEDTLPHVLEDVPVLFAQLERAGFADARQQATLVVQLRGHTLLDQWLPILADELNQVWTNLIHNALQAMNYHGTLGIGIRREANHAIVSIGDTGCGIPAAIQPQIFDAFFTTKSDGEGSGLGLDIVRRIVQKHAGKIEFQSETGVGTTFFVYLPYPSGESLNPSSTILRTMSSPSDVAGIVDD